jgi:hypothetical protein
MTSGNHFVHILEQAPYRKRCSGDKNGSEDWECTNNGQEGRMGCRGKKKISSFQSSLQVLLSPSCHQ